MASVTWKDAWKNPKERELKALDGSTFNLAQSDDAWKNPKERELKVKYF